MKIITTLILLIINFISFSQTNREVAKNQIITLKEDGALIIRVHLNKKNINLYRNPGQEKIANKLENELKINNFLIASAFLDSNYFHFCPVYIIDAKDYKKVNSGEKSGYFLNANLEIDSSIVLKEELYYFIDRGNSFKRIEHSNLTISDAFVIRDKHLNLLKKPFPFFKMIMGRDFATTIMYQFSTRIKYRRNIQNVKIKSNDHHNTYIDMSNLSYKEKFKKNYIIDYLETTYGFVDTEIRLPFNIFKFNYKLEKFYKRHNKKL